MSDFKNNFPYVKPDFEIDETKELVFDKFGNFISIKNVDAVNIEKERIKRFFKRLLIFVIVCGAITESYHFMTNFTPKKWEHEFMRPLIMRDLKKQTEIAYKNKKEIALKKQYDIEQNKRDNMLTKYDEMVTRYNLYFRTPEEIRSFLGEPNPKGYALPELPISGENELYEAYYCYGSEDDAKWIILKYEYGLSYDIAFI